MQNNTTNKNMANKTVLTQLIESIKEMDRRGISLTMEGVATILTNNLEKEKQQIMKTFLEGKVNHSKDWAHQYYNKEYGVNNEQ